MNFFRKLWLLASSWMRFPPLHIDSDIHSSSKYPRSSLKDFSIDIPDLAFGFMAFRESIILSCPLLEIWHISHWNFTGRFFLSASGIVEMLLLIHNFCLVAPWSGCSVDFKPFLARTRHFSLTAQTHLSFPSVYIDVMHFLGDSIQTGTIINTSTAFFRPCLAKVLDLRFFRVRWTVSHFRRSYLTMMAADSLLDFQ